MSVNLDDNQAYKRALNEALAYVNTLNEPLRGTIYQFLEPLSKSSMVKMMTLMPYWVGDLVATDGAVLEQLALAHFYIAWYYHAQDDVIDGQASGEVMLGGHLALLKGVEVYRQLGLTETTLWEEFWRLTELSAETYALETTSHFDALSELTAERLAPFTTEFVINRLAPIFFNTKAQLYLAGVGEDESRYQQVLDALRPLYTSLQLGDDITDWLTDLQAGQINVVAAGLISHLYENRPETTADGLTLEGLAGYQLTAADYWRELEQTITGLNQQALDLLADVEPCRLRDKLLIPHMKQMDSVWPTYHAKHRRLGELFGI